MFRESTIPIVEQALNHKDRLAIVDENGDHSYDELLEAAHRVATGLLKDQPDLEEARVAFMAPPGFDYAAVQWGIWLAGGMALPLCIAHPAHELAYVLSDADVHSVVAHPTFEEKLAPLAQAQGARLVSSSALMDSDGKALPEVVKSRRAMMLYTSGTTGKPKGVVTTHENIAAQITSLIEAWEWSADDRILHVLPLHHVHGIINVLSCALWAGAVCDMLPRFDAATVWKRFAEQKLSLFMAVPTIYVKLIREWEEASESTRTAWSVGTRRMRLMVSGSAALPVKVLEKWKAISGHTLLERYGMTEIGMAISNPLHGERRPGAIGLPLPGVQVALFDEHDKPIEEEDKAGDIRVKGKNVFLEYWRRPEATSEAFRKGWFCTGDTAVVEDGYYRILGRSSVDIIKSGGYKISALEIEESLRTHPDITECAVVGVEDEEWGERVCAAVIVQEGKELSLESLRGWGKDRLAKYKIPTRLTVVDDLPRNQMGKVVKPEVKKLFH